MSRAPERPAAAVEPLRKPVPCPVCSRNSSRADYPFCSPRCRDVDLNRWLSGSYVVPGRPEADEDAD